jgi:tetratricopeptide (TPR) repeat protein
MNLLEELLQSLSDDESEKIFSLPIKGKKREILNLSLHAGRNGQGIDTHKPPSLKISVEHLHEIRSLLLTTVYETLVPEGGIALIEFLARKNLPSHFLKQVRKTEHSVKNAKPEVRAEFFFSVFEALHKFTFNLVNWKMIDTYAQKYLKALPKRNEEDDFAIEVCLLRNSMIRLYADNTGDIATMQNLFSRLSEIVQKTKGTTHALLGYTMYMTLAWHAKAVSEDTQLTLSYHLRALGFAEKLKHKSHESKIATARLRIAESYCEIGNIAKSISSYKAIYDGLSSDDPLWNNYYDLLRYGMILIQAEQFQEAERLMKKSFEPMFNREPNTISVITANNFAMLYLFMGDFPKAKIYIDIALNHNTKTNYTFLGDCNNRITEVAYYFLTGDLDLAMTLSLRARQFLRGKNYRLSDDDFGYKFKIIEELIDFVEVGDPFPEELEEHYQIQARPIEGLTGKLIIKIRESIEK